MNPLDLVAVLLLVLGLLLGFRSGAIPQLAGLLGAIGGGALVVFGLPEVTPLLEGIDPSIRPIVVLGGLLAIVALGESIGSTTGRAIARRLGTGVLGAADRVLGSLVGGAQALLIVWLAGGLLAVTSLAPRLTEAAQTSTAVRGLNAVLPPPDEIAADLGTLLDDSGLPDIFVGFDPLPRPPVDLPEDATARAIAARAEDAVFRVAAATCGLESSGSSVAIDGDYVVTNAHVVAGARDGGVRLIGADGDRTDARVVLFDPELDVALLHAPRLGANALRFATSAPDRGSLGAALGYPGGGGLTVLPAAVAGVYEATVRDIYGVEPVRRGIVELHARIDRGDRGGPFVLEDGTVGGLIFAEGRTDIEVGYAVSPTAVATRVMPALGRTRAVDTGDCLR